MLSLESRRSAEMAELIRKQGGEPFIAPSMREVPIVANAETFAFAERLFADHYDMMILLTGVGTRQLYRVLASRYPEPEFGSALGRLTIVARGPKPVAALREMGLAPTLIAPEPNTWREVLKVTQGRLERHIAVQEYGRSNPELLDGLRARDAEVTPVRVYQWGLPDNDGPLREAARRLAAREFDVALFTAAVQIEHLALVARQQDIELPAIEGLRRCFVASIGPTTTEALEEFDIHPHMEPSHPKIGLLVREAAEQSPNESSE